MQADSVLDQAWTEAERLLNKAEEDASNDGALVELRRQVEKRDEEFTATSRQHRERETALEAAVAGLSEARNAFEAQRTDIVREARDYGYALGLAEAEAQTAAGLAMLAEVNADLEDLGEEPLVAEELVHIEIADESDDSAGNLEFDDWQSDHASDVGSFDESPVEEEVPVEETAEEAVAEVVETTEASRSSGEGRLRVVGSKSIDPSDVSDTMARLWSAWNSPDSQKH